MATYMFILRSTTKKHKVVCPECVTRGEVLTSCPACHGSAIKVLSTPQYYVQDKPIQITSIDRDPNTGVLRYWENGCEFFYETVYPKLNKFVPEVPYGIHLCHDSMLSAQRECDRINSFLASKPFKDEKPDDSIFHF